MMSLSDIFFRGLKIVSRLLDRTRYYSYRYKFINYKKDSDNLVMIVAGYQEYVWDDVFERIKKYTPENFDICVVSPGIYCKKLEQICLSNKWSYLSIKENKLAMAQNTAIKLFEKAKLIYKLDEDIFIGENYYKNIYKTYEKALKDKVYHVGMICPVLNINGASYRFFLNEIGKLDEFEKKFGPAYISCDDDVIYSDGHVGEYMWKITLPLDRRIKEFSEKNVGYFPASCRYSIGAIFFTRDFWENAGKFKVAASGQLAWEELEVCNFCFNRSYTILIAQNVLAGHFGFGKQKNVIKKFYESNEDFF